MAEWQSFYVIVGSSGAALIGIQFVVMTLIASMRQRPASETIEAFGTPTIVHFVAALLVSAIVTAPWHSMVPVAVVLVIGGVAGLGYTIVVIRRARRQTDYRPVWQDWLWYGVMPMLAYGALAVGGALLCARTAAALFAIGASTLGLLLNGIHNSWDTVTHLITRDSPAAAKMD